MAGRSLQAAEERGSHYAEAGRDDSEGDYSKPNLVGGWLNI